MRRHPTIILVALLLAGCASGQANSPFQPGGPNSTLQLVVGNETLETVTAYVDWDSGGRTRLGEIAAGQRRTFTLPLNGQRVRVDFAQIGRTPQALTDFELAQAGDAFEWVLRTNGTVFYRRLN